MAERNVTIETIAAIEKAAAEDCKDLVLSDQKDRARLAIWIFNNFVDGDLAQRAARRDTRRPHTIIGVEPKP